MDNICICIPARFNSSRLPGKLTMKLDNITVIEKTFLEAKKSKIASKIFILTDNNNIKKIFENRDDVTVIMTDENCKNGTERISTNLNKIDQKFDLIVNVQGDEPFIDYRNIDHAIEKHLKNNCENLFYTTLHQKIEDVKYLESPSCLTVQFTRNNDVMTYSRSILPGNKTGKPDLEKYDYYGFTGIYVFNREYLKEFHNMENSKYQDIEDIEQMKIIENGYKIKTFECPYFNEISLNDSDDLNYLMNKYVNKTEKKDNKKIKLAIFDYDGVFTDGKIYVDENGIKTKCYNGKDSFGLKLLKEKGIKTALITADDSDCVRKATHVISRMDMTSIGKYEKLEVLNNWIKELNISYEEISYIGDDLFDIPVLEKVGLSGCPSDAIDEVKAVCTIICKKGAGKGCVREFINSILNY
jgi:3-deoxy-D-manno-octulosonate cytidylyltransferase